MIETMQREVKSGPDAGVRARLLLVDDDRAALSAYRRVLTRLGYDVDACGDGAQAVERVRSQRYDSIVSDISMPGMDGMQLLRRVREHDLDVPVVLMTGLPTLETAMKAVELGALRYLAKPVSLDELERVVAGAVRQRQFVSLEREALALAGGTGRVLGDRAELEGRFARALETLWMAYQPIVAWRRREVYAYEALVRTAEPTIPHPGALLDAAERLGRLHDLGRAIRANVAAALPSVPGGACLFVNLHPADLDDGELFDPASPLSRVAGRVVLEITERASLDAIADVKGRVAALRALGFRIAIDDLGAGYAGLTALAELEPEVVKLDMALVRDVDRSPKKARLVQAITALCEEGGLKVVAEGVETAAERDALDGLGCELLQGYLFARPGRPFPAVELTSGA